MVCSVSINYLCSISRWVARVESVQNGWFAFTSSKIYRGKGVKIGRVFRNIKEKLRTLVQRELAGESKIYSCVQNGWVG